MLKKKKKDGEDTRLHHRSVFPAFFSCEMEQKGIGRHQQSFLETRIINKTGNQLDFHKKIKIKKNKATLCLIANSFHRRHLNPGYSNPA